MQHTASTPIAEAWGDWLTRYDWSHWATLTFRNYQPRTDPSGTLGPARAPANAGPSPMFARRAFNTFLARLSSPVRGCPPYFRGDELGPRTGRLHQHALLGLRGDVPAAALRRAWTYGFAVIEDYDPTKGAAHYIAKYVTKDFQDYDIGARLPPLLPLEEGCAGSGAGSGVGSGGASGGASGGGTGRAGCANGTRGVT